MFNILIRKTIIAIISTSVLSLILTFISYTPQADQLSNMEYMSFSGLFILYGIYLLGMYLVFGIAFSLFIDQKFNNLKHVILLYATVGAIIGGSFHLTIAPLQYLYLPKLLGFVITGVVASLLFLVLQKLFDRFISVIIKQ